QTGFEGAWLLEPIPLPQARKGPGFVLVTAGKGPVTPLGLPFQIIDLTRESEDTVASYAVFRRYLFDYRSDLTTPLLVLIDEQGRAHKVYPDVPGAENLRSDLRLMSDPDRLRLALPFAGRYYVEPHRNYFRLGAAFYWSGYPEQALIYLGEAVRRQPDNAKAQLATGHIHLTAGRYDMARGPLESAARLTPDSPDAWVNLGSLEAAVENYPAALQNFERALKLRPEMAFALAGAGQAHARMGNLTAAETELRRALDLDPRNPDVADQLGLLLARQGRLEEAKKRFQDAIAAQRGHASAINNLG